MPTTLQRLVALSLTTLAGGLSYVVAARTASGDPRPFAILLGVGLVMVVAEYPRAAAAALLVLGATILPTHPLPFSVGGIRTDVVELLGLLVVAAWLLESLVRGLPRPRLLAPLLLFEAAVALGLVVGATRGTPRDVLVGSGKSYLLYLLAPALAALFATHAQQNQLERYVIRVCDLGAIALVSFTALGLPLGTNAVDTQVYFLGQATQASRIRVPLLELIVLGVLLVVARMVSRRRHQADAARLALYSVPVLLSFNRSTWLPLVLAVLLLLRLRRGERRPGRALAMALVIVTSFGLLIGAADRGYLGENGRAVVARATSVLSPEVTHDFSFTERHDEVSLATRALRKSPLLGVGVGRPYGARLATYLPDPPRIVYSDRLYSHNTFLAVWLQLGLLGLFSVLLLGVGVARECVLGRRDLPPHESTRQLAAALAVLAFAGSALLQTSLGDTPTTLALCCALALAQRPRDRVPDMQSPTQRKDDLVAS